MGPMEGTKWEVHMGLIFTPVLVRCFLGPLGLSAPMIRNSWTHRYVHAPNSPIQRYNLSLAAQPPPTTQPTHPFIHAISDITAVVKLLLK